MQWALLILAVLILAAAVAMVVAVWRLKGQVAGAIEKASSAEAGRERAQALLAAETNKTYRLQEQVKELQHDVAEAEQYLQDSGDPRAAALRLRQRLSRGGV